MWLLYYTGTNTINNLLWYHVNKSLAEIHCMHFFLFTVNSTAACMQKRKKNFSTERNVKLCSYKSKNSGRISK